MRLFPDWTHVLTPPDLGLPYRGEYPCVYLICLRDRTIPRLCGRDDQGILTIGYTLYPRMTFQEFVRASMNGRTTQRSAQTLYYFSKISPGISELFNNGPKGPFLEFYFIKGAKDLWLECMVSYIRSFGELPPLDGLLSYLPMASPKKTHKEDWIYFKHPSALRVDAPPAIYRVHLERPDLHRWLGPDPSSIFYIGKSTDPHARLTMFLWSAQTGSPKHDGGQKLHQYSRICPGLKTMLGKDIPKGLRFSLRYVDRSDLFPQENRSTDLYTSPFGELPPGNGEITGGRKRMDGLLKHYTK